MKVTINIDCTPKEARVFSDLADFEPMLRHHDLRTSMDIMNSETQFKSWLPMRPKSWEQPQKVPGVKLTRSPRAIAKSDNDKRSR